ncbi:hypothetical protein H9L10_03480 [Phycicoccus endophyticus]|uniref:Uncharacterized protein n=1 Tax=Phycicoccus endophyticus TaxID=1690220 RepID=A0A7G9R3F5_9MICO|nr:hypothetical protein [Phycicoccus endophyticus]NHI19886.1 hypothetical protein [Phycicoccus endophyticus]QNN50130.1 hypothetical protein H9L10_03480 [Phycicoccus endophyticus]GGL27772.1 hypothetical protein GCM10012283_07470 [Phycicoccus endophyticus]
MLQKIKPFLPVIAMVVAAVLQALVAVWSDGITLAEGLVVVVAFGGALTTYLVPSISGVAPWAKTVVAAFTAGAVVLADAAAAGGLDGAVVMTAAVAVLFGLFPTAASESEARDYALAA